MRIVILFIYRAPDVCQKDLVANISIYSLLLYLSRFVYDLRCVENIPNIEQECKIGYRNMQTEVVAAVGLYIYILRVVHPVKYILPNSKVEMVNIQ